MHSFATSWNSTVPMDALPSHFPANLKVAVSWMLSQLPCIGCARTSRTNLGSRNLRRNLRSIARRGLRSPEDHPLLLTLILFAAIVIPLLCLYGLRLYARRRRVEEREDIEASIRYRLELQNNIDRLERDFMIPGSVAEPLPPYFPRPPAYSLEMDSTTILSPLGSADSAISEETKIAPLSPVHSRQRPSTATCLPGLGHEPCPGSSPRSGQSCMH
ncbi:hypothetical protein EV361DRAFT_909161 [Lentinula raphanica]|uniref:Uncharacterized protein n=1 Tax=Lentinula raphanica TaxID=153919 RepID=A0AA38PM35_9AGAR|nr:hypothetical protein F5880DRAFT_1599792 [Lentinula raphanica]KAJ3845483.1 hypothetical protein F5878DRAFT_599307 [Lentinula raphanica]KAJ3971777.1 hypothetical protein EV361DRAFT_909161 [Lentinula raphanica]